MKRKIYKERMINTKYFTRQNINNNNQIIIHKIATNNK